MEDNLSYPPHDNIMVIKSNSSRGSCRKGNIWRVHPIDPCHLYAGNYSA